MNNKFERKQATSGSDIGMGYVAPFLTSTYPKSFVHNVYVKNVLESPEEMVAVIDIMANCSEDDDIIFHINSPGGSVDSLDGLLFAMARCPAHKHGIGSGTIASAATYILLACDTYEVSPFTQLLFHSASFGSYGKQRDVVDHASFIHNQCERFTREYYKHLFTEEELVDIIDNKREFWMTADEFLSRMEGRESAFIKEMEDEVAEQEAILDEIFNPPMPSKEVLRKKFTKEQLIAYALGELLIDENGNIVEEEDDL